LKKASEQLAKELDSLRQQVAKVEQQLAALPDGLPQEVSG
jgi:prefoldin subunit 5